MIHEYSRTTVKHQNRKRYTGIPRFRPGFVPEKVRINKKKSHKKQRNTKGLGAVIPMTSCTYTEYVHVLTLLSLLITIQNKQHKYLAHVNCKGRCKQRVLYDPHRAVMDH